MADLILYDGVCGLCNGLNQFLLARDRADRFRFASLQGHLAREVLRRHGRNADDLDTVYVLPDYGTPTERLLSRSRAIIHVLTSLGGLWRAARLLGLFPVALADVLYTFVARRRYGWFGRYDACPMPLPHHRAKFLDDARPD